MELLTDRINNNLEKKKHLINEHALNREPVPLRHDNLIIAGFHVTPFKIDQNKNQTFR